MDKRLQQKQQLQDAAFGAQTRHEAAVEATGALYDKVMASYAAAHHHSVRQHPALSVDPLGFDHLMSVRPSAVRRFTEQQRRPPKTGGREALQLREETSGGIDRHQPAARPSHQRRNETSKEAAGGRHAWSCDLSPGERC